jgi:hypothetical protein
MRFFSKIVFCCNLCFVAAGILRWVENMNKAKGVFTGAIKLQPLESTIVVLGYGAILINFIFNLFVLLLLFSKKVKAAKVPAATDPFAKISIGSKKNMPVEKWLIWTNFLFLLAQIYYFFFSNF